MMSKEIAARNFQPAQLYFQLPLYFDYYTIQQTVVLLNKHKESPLPCPENERKNLVIITYFMTKALLNPLII